MVTRSPRSEAETSDGNRFLASAMPYRVMANNMAIPVFRVSSRPERVRPGQWFSLSGRKIGRRSAWGRGSPRVAASRFPSAFSTAG